MTNIGRVFTVGAAALIFVSVSAANTISYTSTFGPSTTDFSHVFSLSDFNPALGTLTGVQLELDANENISSLALSNLGNVTETNFTALATSNIKGITNTANAADAISAFTLVEFDSSVNFPGGMSLGPAGSGNCPLDTPSASCANVNFDPPAVADSKIKNSASVAGYIGAGSFNITGATTAFSSFSGGGGNISLAQNTNATLTAKVTYTYTPPSGVPEPATMLLMGSALLGVALFRKRIVKP